MTMRFTKKLFTTVGLLLVLGFFAYSLIEYRKSGIAEEGIVTCANGQCFWSAHIHVDVPIQICGQKYTLPKFKGSLANLHTHGEENIVHWHNKVAFDPGKKKFLEAVPFALNLIFKIFELPITDDSLLGKKDGDRCGGVPASWKVFVNGMHNTDWRNYEWNDHDIVAFVFDGRTVQEVEQELRKNPTVFPSVAEE